MAAKPQLEVIYVKMPITIDRKHELNAQGLRAVDIRFMPEGYENPTADEPVAATEVVETEAEKKARRAAERAAKKAAKAAQANGSDEGADEGQEDEE